MISTVFIKASGGSLSGHRENTSPAWQVLGGSCGGTPHSTRAVQTEMICLCPAPPYDWGMFSYVVIFWTDPDNPGAPDELIEGAKRYLAPIPGVQNFHIGRMVPSHRPVVDQTYQVGLNIQ